MQKPEIPQDEAKRLETLRSLKILDTPEEERFDRLTRMAKKIFNVPIALISLVDENRQWFKSHNGLEIRETPREISFCGHAILGEEIFIVNDAVRDERFSDNPLVLGEPHIRFYASCPLEASNGSKMGTLCIIDQEPHSLNEEDRQLLVDLAQLAQQELSGIQLATLDELTGLTNRRGFMALSEHSLRICRRQKIPSSLIFMDLNKFKPINDQFGHAEGDRALRSFSRIMKDIFRDSDLFARLGGDEFVALLTNTSQENAEKVMQRFNETLEQYNRDSGLAYDIQFSYGVVEFHAEKFQTIQELLSEGDRLMYMHKMDKRE